MAQLWNEDVVLNRVKRAFLSREGFGGIRSAVLQFEAIQTKTAGFMTRDELMQSLLACCGLQLSAQEAEHLVRAFDTTRGQRLLSIKEFLAFLVFRTVNSRRREIIARCYDALTKRCGTPLRAADVLREFDPLKHPLVLVGKATQRDIETELHAAFREAAQSDGTISREEFSAFLAGVSATVPNDDVFDVMLLRVFRTDDPAAPKLAETMSDRPNPIGGLGKTLHSAYSDTLYKTCNSKSYDTSGLYRTKYNRPDGPTLPSLKTDHLSTTREAYPPLSAEDLKSTLPKKDVFSPTGSPALDAVRRKALDLSGPEGLLELQRALQRILGVPREHEISADKIVSGLRSVGIRITPGEASAIMQACPGGVSSIAAFCRHLAGPIRSQPRVEIVLMTFQTLDEQSKGFLTLQNVLQRLDASMHPLVESGAMQPDDVRHVFEAYWETSPILPTDWIDYYACVSCAIDDDQHFERMLRNLWHVTGTLSLNKVRRAVAIFDDGRQQVLQLPVSDVGVDDENLINRLKLPAHTRIIYSF